MDDEQIVKAVEDAMANLGTVVIAAKDAEKIVQVKQLVAGLANALIQSNERQRAAKTKPPGGRKSATT
jgi:hypothetical protein